MNKSDDFASSNRFNETQSFSFVADTIVVVLVRKYRRLSLLFFLLLIR